jgi:hypothetical protein
MGHVLRNIFVEVITYVKYRPLIYRKITAFREVAPFSLVEVDQHFKMLEAIRDSETSFT